MVVPAIVNILTGDTLTRAFGCGVDIDAVKERLPGLLAVNLITTTLSGKEAKTSLVNFTPLTV
jgi:hypothetical protein